MSKQNKISEQEVKKIAELSKLSLKSEKENFFEITSGIIMGSVWAYSLSV